MNQLNNSVHQNVGGLFQQQIQLQQQVQVQQQEQNINIQGLGNNPNISNIPPPFGSGVSNLLGGGPKNVELRFKKRRKRDSNPRNPFGVHTLSKRTSSATRALLLSE